MADMTGFTNESEKNNIIIPRIQVILNGWISLEKNKLDIIPKYKNHNLFYKYLKEICS